jgi:hypothetical protein
MAAKASVRLDQGVGATSSLHMSVAATPWSSAPRPRPRLPEGQGDLLDSGIGVMMIMRGRRVQRQQGRRFDGRSSTSIHPLRDRRVDPQLPAGKSLMPLVRVRPRPPDEIFAGSPTAAYERSGR